MDGGVHMSGLCCFDSPQPLLPRCSVVSTTAKHDSMKQVGMQSKCFGTTFMTLKQAVSRHHIEQYNKLLGFWSNFSTEVSIKYILNVNSISPEYGSVYGGSHVTLRGSGFSSNPQDILVQIGK